MRTSPSVGLPVLVLSVLATGGTCVEDAVASKAAAHGGALAGHRYRVLVSTDIGGTEEHVL